MKIQKKFSIRVCSSFLFVIFFAANNSAFSYESLEWQKSGMFGNVSSSHSSSHSAANKIRNTKPSKLGKIRHDSTNKKSSKVARRNQRSNSGHRVEYASLGNTIKFVAPNSQTRHHGQRKSKSKRRVSRGVIWVASSRCLSKKLKSAIYHVARNWGRVRVNSTCRSRKHNRRVGGSKHSYHLSGRAADIRVWGDVRAAARYLRKVSGGYKHYGGGLFHIDTGPRRTW